MRARRLTGAAAVLLALAAGCSEDPADRSLTPEATPACGSVAAAPSGALETLTVRKDPNGTTVIWPPSSGAECVRVERTGSAPVVLPGDRAVHTFADPAVPRVEPVTYTVRVFQGGAVVRQFSATVGCAG